MFCVCVCVHACICTYVCVHGLVTIFASIVVQIWYSMFRCNQPGMDSTVR